MKRCLREEVRRGEKAGSLLAEVREREERFFLVARRLEAAVEVVAAILVKICIKEKRI
jgi:hypothetical protein